MREIKTRKPRKHTIARQRSAHRRDEIKRQRAAKELLYPPLYSVDLSTGEILESPPPPA
jgi:hypothetical protein